MFISLHSIIAVLTKIQYYIFCRGLFRVIPSLNELKSTRLQNIISLVLLKILKWTSEINSYPDSFMHMLLITLPIPPEEKVIWKPPRPTNGRNVFIRAFHERLCSLKIACSLCYDISDQAVNITSVIRCNNCSQIPSNVRFY